MKLEELFSGDLSQIHIPFRERIHIIPSHSTVEKKKRDKLIHFLLCNGNSQNKIFLAKVKVMGYLAL